LSSPGISSDPRSAWHTAVRWLPHRIPMSPSGWRYGPNQTMGPLGTHSPEPSRTVRIRARRAG